MAKKDPREIAQGAADRLCSYNISKTDPDNFFEQTADNLGVFLHELIVEVAFRLNEAAQSEINKGKIKEIDEALEKVREQMARDRND